MKEEKGFTITELMFAMSILAIVLIIILGSTIQITRMYNKGLTLKRVNQSGRTIGEELQRSIQSSDGVVFHPQQSGPGGKYKGARLCLGKTSFIWNIGNDFVAGHGNRYQDGELVTFVKVNDPDRLLCNVYGWNIDIDKSKSTNLLSDGLVVQEPTIFSQAGKLVNGSYTISTPDDPLNSIFDLSGAGKLTCKGGATDDFCALNTFNVTVYARGFPGG